MTQTVTQPQKNTSRKVKALLAGGLVLGVGAAVTLAAWTDQEWAQGIFGTGSFNIESSVDGTQFDDNESDDDAAELTFDMPASQNLSPGDTVAAPFVLRLDADSTYDANVSLENATADPDNPGLSYGITQVDSTEACTAAASGTDIVPAGTALDSTEGASTFDLTAGEETAGEPVTLCFQVSADESLAEGVSTTAHWQFVGTSQE